MYSQTQLQTTFGINIVALDDGQPKILNLKDLLEAFVKFRREVVTRRTVYLLRKARERGHILEGLAVAISNIDEVITLIKNSASPADAKDGLMTRVGMPLKWRLILSVLVKMPAALKIWVLSLVCAMVTTIYRLRKLKQFSNCVCIV